MSDFCNNCGRPEPCRCGDIAVLSRAVDRLCERLQARMLACCNQTSDSCRECALDEAVMKETLDA